MVNRYAAEHIIINGEDNIEPWINRYFIPEEEYQQLEAENAQLKAEVDKLREWQQIILGTGTDREAVIRMAATKYTEIAVQSWRDEVEKLKAELARCHADKAEMVTRNKLLRDRPDLPLERLAAYDEIMNQLAQATQERDGAYNVVAGANHLLLKAGEREARLKEALVRIANHGPMMLARGEYRRGQMDMLGGIVRIAKQALEEAGT